ncbi:lipocalin family protein [Mucilaginibacter ginkgonis]|uniref:Lipocalin family protein n=1 Tax=Mucilaginibacter ginkgonis TaxID=2682091 RepID=A0A6I4HZP9_9SPHI|nr:lipocalin family protein [Mucilaginibacter ginkgonis]QQL50064.1 lipocalin family protein [Mucilaginibacter ginkgonis]
MRKYLHIFTFLVLVGTLQSCTGGINQATLTGKWNYVKVGVPNSSPPDTVTRAELEENKPYIEFKADNNFTITWGGKTLSHGRYAISGKNLKINEDLGNGKHRDFQFYVSDLTAKSITFETVGAGGSRVTAIKN